MSSREVRLIDGTTIEVMHGADCVGIVQRNHRGEHESGAVFTTTDARQFIAILTQQTDYAEETP